VAFGDEDHRRDLTTRGSADAYAAGEWLDDHGFAPTHALVSSATRTRATWAALAEGSGSAAEATVDDALYIADPDSVLDVLRSVPEDAEVVAYVGHNPTAASLAHLLDDGGPDPQAFRRMSAGFPTMAMAVLEVPVAWADLDPGTAHLAAFHVGHG